MPVSITVYDGEHWINLSANFIGTQSYDAGKHNRVDSMESVYTWNEWDTDTAVRAVYVEPDGEGTVTFNTLRLCKADEVE